MTATRMKFAIDDGSTNVKISWIENGTLKTVVSPNSFRKDWKSAALLRGQSVYNVLGGFDPGIDRFNGCFQRAAVAFFIPHYALPVPLVNVDGMDGG